MANTEILNSSSVQVLTGNQIGNTNVPPVQQKVESSKVTTPAASTGINEYMVWSIINLFVGAIILGIPAVILSRLTRKFKREDNMKLSKILSITTLVYNIFVSFIALVGLVFLITYYTGPL